MAYYGPQWTPNIVPSLKVYGYSIWEVAIPFEKKKYVGGSWRKKISETPLHIF